MKNTTRWILIISSFVIIISILTNTYIFFQRFKDEERTKMKIWAEAQAEFLQTTDLDRDLGDLTLEVLKNNNSTPMIYEGLTGELRVNNIPEDRVKDTIYLKRKIKEFSRENQPIEVSYKDETYGTLYYGNSAVLTNLKYYPLALVLIMILFSASVYFFFHLARTSDQNKLWAGMAKETAHQIGTPLSSLLGWNEILKTENTAEWITSEISKDVDRLQTITERFSKIGSVPALTRSDLVAETQKTFSYLEARSSRKVHFSFFAEPEEIWLPLNAQLYSWTIENLINNAIDAMKGEGSLEVRVEADKRQARVTVTDTGKGIPRSDYNRIFKPGYTTKKRGWGLGLSLVKRIIEDYHKGKVRVTQSVLGKGSSIQITLKLS